MPGAWIVTLAVSLADTGVAPCGAPPAASVVSPWNGSTVSRPRPVLSASTDPCATSLTFVLSHAGAPVEEGADRPLVQGVASWTPSAPLTDLDTWCFTAQATDPTGASAGPSAESCFVLDTENLPPSAPVWVTPAASGVIADDHRFTLAPATDPEHRALRYQVELAERGGSVSQGTDLAASDLVGHQLLGLDEDTWYVARARATDGDRWGPWATRIFFVNDVNRAPSAPSLDPAYIDLTLGRVTLSAHDAADPEGFPVRYAFELRDATGAVRMSWEDLRPDADGYATLSTRAVPVGRWQWTARAVDAQGRAGAWAATLPVHLPSPEELPSDRLVPADGGPGLGASGCGCDTPARLPVGWAAVLAVLWRRRR